MASRDEYSKSASRYSYVLEPVLKQIDELDLEISVPGGIRHLKAKLLLGVFDLPAKAAALNVKQFNGEYGCNYCLDKGKYVLRRRIYPPNAAHRARKTKDVEEWASKAQRIGSSVYGVKGVSVLAPYISIPECVPVNYMHAVLEGVTKSLMNYWFDSKYHSYSFYLGTQIKQIDRA